MRRMLIAFDLDDTLFSEMEFVRSAYRKIASLHGMRLLQGMMSAPSVAAAFDSTGLPPYVFLPLYRNHLPDLSLPAASLYTLASLRNAGHTLALVTDGRTMTQSNKIDALRLRRFISDSDIYISERFGHLKADGAAFADLMRRHPGDRYMYVGDNPDKDFRQPNLMGWTTVCLLDSGDNVNHQNFERADKTELPDFKIRSLYELLSLVI